MTKRLAERMNASRSRAETLVQTESAHVAAEATARSYAETGVQQYEFVATLDLRTSDICRALDGKVFSVPDKQTGINYPPMHPRCRSTTAPHYDDFNEDSVRAARDLITGKTVYVPSDMTYAEWHKEYVEGNPEAMFAERSHKNRAADKKQYQQYISEIGRKNVAKSLDEFQRMKYNNSPEFELLKKYASGVRRGWISPQAGFDNYSTLCHRIENEIVGQTTSNGVIITGQSEHFMQRVLGTMADPEKGRPRSGVGLEDVKGALRNPVAIGKRRITTNGKASIKFTGEHCQVSVNPDDGTLIQVNPRRG